MNYTNRIYQTELLVWLETCRGVCNYALRELKEWMASRQRLVDRCSLEKEYIVLADEPLPSYHRQPNNLPKAKKQFPHFPHLSQVPFQVLQATIRRLNNTWDAFCLPPSPPLGRGVGENFPRLKKFGQFKSFVFPKFKNNPLSGNTIKLPKVGNAPIDLHRPIPDGFNVKPVRVVSKVRGTQWYVVVTILER
ncbi:hypothetical protein POG22_10705 [Geitlerinema sp. CS-897]|nr:hypothetical protein [Geitlerinema sp. CS-897]